MVKTSERLAHLVQIRLETSSWAQVVRFRLTSRVVNSVEFPSCVLLIDGEHR